MKTRSNFILILAAVAVIACSKESKVEFSKVQTFTATLETPTKTTLVPGDDGKLTKMEFKAGDAIAIFDESGNRYKFTTEEGGSSASFTGAVTAKSSTWYAVYPYREDAKLYTDTKDFATILPEVQFAVKDNIPSNVSILIASCSNEDKSLQFHHRAGYIKLNVPDGCVSVTLETLTKTPLSGGYYMQYGSGNNSWSTKFRYNSVTLVAPDGGTMSGTYYMAVLPIEYNGEVLLTMRHKDGRISVKKATTGLIVKAGQIRPVNVEPAWIQDDGLQLYTQGGAEDKCSISADNSSFEDVTDVKLIGEKTTKWIVPANGKQGYFKVKFVEEQPDGTKIEVYNKLDKYLDGDYALEYFVKAVPKEYPWGWWELLFHGYAYQSQTGYGSLTKQFTVDGYKNGDGKDTYQGINDTEWHRISDPNLTKLKDVTGYQGLWRLEISTAGNTSTTSTDQANVYYFDDFRIVRKTPTSTRTEYPL